MNELNPVKTLTTTPEWIEVENIFKNKISELMDIRLIDERLSQEDMKIEVRARQIAIDKFVEFLKENNFSKAGLMLILFVSRLYTSKLISW